MLFHTATFYAFFLVVFCVYWSLPTALRIAGRILPLDASRQRAHRWRMTWLLAASCYFYMSWNPWFILLIGASATIDYFVAMALPRAVSLARRRVLLGVSLATNLGALAFFKYSNFLLDSANGLAGWVGVEYDQPIYDILVPLGISFYTFEAISYVVDVYQRRIEPVTNIVDYALFIMFFPHLVAGPIVRPSTFLPQVRKDRRFHWPRVELGLRIFLMGVVKKAVIADHIGGIVDPVFAEPAAHSSATTWIVVFAYAIQVYCDFSGYSDMAIGVAHTLGFRLPENFRMPFFAENIAELWQRWHMTLTTWLRDYVALPLRKVWGRRHGDRVVLTTFFVVGLWHGASWNFVIWGLYNGALLTLRRHVRWPRPLDAPLLRPLRIAVTFTLFALGGVFFRSPSVADSGRLLAHLFWPSEGARLSSLDAGIIAAIFTFIFACHVVGAWIDVERALRRLPAPLLAIGLVLVILLIQVLLPLENKVFIYFQF